MMFEALLLLGLLLLSGVCWRISVQLGKIETILAVQIKNLDKMMNEPR